MGVLDDVQHAQWELFDVNCNFEVKHLTNTYAISEEHLTRHSFPRAPLREHRSVSLRAISVHTRHPGLAYRQFLIS